VPIGWELLVILLTVAVIAETVVLVGLARQVGGVLLQLRPPMPGGAEGGPESGTTARAPGLPIGSPKVLLFVSPDCQLCDFLRPSIPVLHRAYPQVAVVPVLVGKARGESTTEYLGRFGDVAPDPTFGGLAATWNVPGTPFAVGVDGLETVRGSGIVNSLDQLEALAEMTLAPPIGGADGSSMSDAQDEFESASRPEVARQ
jgi:hypothetical protein